MVASTKSASDVRHVIRMARREAAYGCGSGSKFSEPDHARERWNDNMESRYAALLATPPLPSRNGESLRFWKRHEREISPHCGEGRIRLPWPSGINSLGSRYDVH